ncbi:MAG: sigma-70 family RNA polymerase sigma factor [Acidimicrobiia bacterium]
MLHGQTETDVFTGFVRRFEPNLRRALTAAFGSEVGREATAEALAYGWQHWGRVGEMANPSGYLFRVGQNKARRMSRRYRWFGREGVTFDEPWVEPGLEEAWTLLSDRQRVVVGLVHGFEWTFGEVAELLGVSRGTVQEHERRAMTKLRGRLGVEE